MQKSSTRRRSISMEEALASVRRFEVVKRVQPKRACRLVFMKDGVPTECGGKIKMQEIDQSLDSHASIGGPSEPPVFTYGRCSKCHVMYDL